MIAEFLTVIPKTPSLVLITYRPEYRGVLTRVRGAQSIALAPLSDPETAALIAELLGPTPRWAGWRRPSPRGPPVTRFLPRRLCVNSPIGAYCGGPGAYTSTAEGAEVRVPATLQATIAGASIGSTQKRNAP